MATSAEEERVRVFTAAVNGTSLTGERDEGQPTLCVPEALDAGRDPDVVIAKVAAEQDLKGRLAEANARIAATEAKLKRFEARKRQDGRPVHHRDYTGWREGVVPLTRIRARHNTAECQDECTYDGTDWYPIGDREARRKIWHASSQVALYDDERGSKRSWRPESPRADEEGFLYALAAEPGNTVFSPGVTFFTLGNYLLIHPGIHVTISEWVQKSEAIIRTHTGATEGAARARKVVKVAAEVYGAVYMEVRPSANDSGRMMYVFPGIPAARECVSKLATRLSKQQKVK